MAPEVVAPQVGVVAVLSPFWGWLDGRGHPSLHGGYLAGESVGLGYSTQVCQLIGKLAACRQRLAVNF
jgi:hypothetical protein